MATDDEPSDLSAELLRSVIDGLPHPVLVVDRKGRVALANLPAADLLGGLPKEVEGRLIETLFDRAAPALLQAVEATRGGAPPEAPRRLKVTGGGTPRCVDATFAALSGGLTQVNLVDQGPVELPRARADLLEARLTLAEDSANLGLWELDPATGRGWWSDGFRRLFDLPPDLPPSVDALDGVRHPDDWDIFTTLVEEVLRTGQPREYLGRTHPDLGPVRYIQFAMTRRDGPHAAPLISGTALDVSPYQRALEQLEATNARLSLILDHSPSFILFIKADGSLNFVNKVIDGYDAARILSDPSSYLDEEGLAQFAACMKRVFGQGQAASLEAADTLGNIWEARFVPLDTEGATPEAIGFVTNVTDRYQAREEKARLESQLQHAQKLESLGVLAGGIAHDFNNLLAGILGNAELAQRMTDADAVAAPFIAEIVKTSERAAELCRQLLAYSGKGHFVVKPTDLSDVVRDMVSLLDVTIPRNVNAHYDLAPDLPAVVADVAQMQQVVLNLITNAAESIQDPPGDITITTGARRCGPDVFADTWLNDQLEPGRYVFLRVEDTGCGMDDDTAAHIFDPFFSTKATGRGLGLAAVLGIIRGHMGAIHIDSTPGAGTTVEVFFPASGELALPRAPEPPASAPDATHTGTVLVADDDPAVLGMVEQALLHAGYRVICATDGKEAVELFEAQPGVIQLVLLDLTMPHLDGEQTYRRLKARRSDLPIVVMSGFSHQEDALRLIQDDAPFLPKPFRLSRLLDVLHDCLS